MQTLHVKRQDVIYTPVAYSDSMKFDGDKYPEEIQIALNVSKLEMGLNNGSALGVMLERSIDGVIVGETPFETVNLDLNGDINPWMQTIVLKKGDIDANGKEIILGNEWRFHYFLSESDPKIPSKASFEVAVNVK